MDGVEPKAFQEMEEVKEMIARDNHVTARNKLLKLQRQFPAIDEFLSMISVCDVLNSANFDLLDGETDWYLVLQAPQAASEPDVESEYNKISTLLKPIKAHFSAAESALKIVEEAYSVLSNPEKRSIFDKKRTSKFETCELLSTLAEEDIVQNNEIRPTPTTSEMATYTTTNRTDNVGNFKDSRLNMFRDENDCDKRDVNFTGISPLRGCNQECFSFNSIKSSELFEVGQVWAAYDHECMPRSYFRIHKIEKSPLRFHVNCLRPDFMCEMGLPIVCGLFNVDKNDTKIIVPAMLSHIVCNYASEQVLVHPKEHEVWAMYGELDPHIKCSDPEARKNSKLEVVEIVTGYTKSGNMLAARLVKVDGFKFNYVFSRQTKNGHDHDHEQVFSIPSDNLCGFSHRIPAHRFVGGDMDGMFELDPYAVPSTRDSPDQSITDTASSDSGTKSFEPENKWGLKDFACNQIWAVRDDPDAMPRGYVVVNNVDPEGDICVTMLEPNVMCADVKRWVERGLPLACGSFKAGKSTRVLGVCQFSHVVRCERSQGDSSYRIYPKKGEVWAMYKNWNCKWDQSDFTCCQYQMVEIVADLGDGSDTQIRVASLVEVPGFMTLFQRQRCTGHELIPRAEFLSFSHRIVASRVQATEDNGISTPFWHLEPDFLGSSNVACLHNISSML